MSRGRRSDDSLLVVLLTGVPWWSAPTAAAVTAGLIFWLYATGNPWGKGVEPLWWIWTAAMQMPAHIWANAIDEARTPGQHLFGPPGTGDSWS
jgi:hypothetical protein